CRAAWGGSTRTGGGETVPGTFEPGNLLQSGGRRAGGAPGRGGAAGGTHSRQDSRFAGTGQRHSAAARRPILRPDEPRRRAGAAIPSRKGKNMYTVRRMRGPAAILGALAAAVCAAQGPEGAPALKQPGVLRAE